jgi:hypothetical protein
MDAKSGQARIMVWTSERSLGEKSMQSIRQGDVILLPVAQTSGVTVPQELRKKQPHLTLAPR